MVSSPGPTPLPRLGLIVSKRCGPAVTRNRIKRRLRSVADKLEFESGTDYVIIASSQVANTPFDRLTGWLERAVEDLADA